jgi:hypothetical protein
MSRNKSERLVLIRWGSEDILLVDRYGVVDEKPD